MTEQQAFEEAREDGRAARYGDAPAVESRGEAVARADRAEAEAKRLRPYQRKYLRAVNDKIAAKAALDALVTDLTELLKEFSVEHFIDVEPQPLWVQLRAVIARHTSGANR
jgi:hypothetical protein